MVENGMQMREALNHLPVLNNAEKIREARATALNRETRERKEYGTIATIIFFMINHC